MVYLRVSDLEHTYGAFRVLNNVSFSIKEGERLCLLGPSGCGKTTTLQSLAGFVRPDRGIVEIAGKRIDSMPPEKRNIGIMFQNYALFPHMSVFDNVAFGLRMRNLPKEEIGARVTDALRLVRLPNAASKMPSQLSGGEQQRIAFARAVVIKPSLLLLDEPFSNLDARLRLEMRSELLDLLQTLRIATVMVTHDQEEAMAIGDRIAVMYKGRIEQVGSPQEIYDSPATLFVGRFVGESNVFDGKVRSVDNSRVRVEIDSLGDVYAKPSIAASAVGGVKVMVRPERITLTRDGHDSLGDDWNSIPGTVEQVLYLGSRVEWTIRTGASTLLAWQSQPLPFECIPGSKINVNWRLRDTLLVSEEQSNAIH